MSLHEWVCWFWWTIYFLKHVQGVASACGSALRVLSGPSPNVAFLVLTIFIFSCDQSFSISPPLEVVDEVQVETVGASVKNGSYSVEKHPAAPIRPPSRRLLFNCAWARPNSQNQHRRKTVFAMEVAGAPLLGFRENRVVFCKVRTFPWRMTPCPPHHST